MLRLGGTDGRTEGPTVSSGEHSIELCVLFGGGSAGPPTVRASFVRPPKFTILPHPPIPHATRVPIPLFFPLVNRDHETAAPL